MTYASDTVRMLFHQLPTETQVEYSDMEARLAKRSQRLHIDGVMRHGQHSEVVIRIFAEFKDDADAGVSSRS